MPLDTRARARRKVECVRRAQLYSVVCSSVLYVLRSIRYRDEQRREHSQPKRPQEGKREAAGGKERGRSARGFAPFASSTFFLPLFFPLPPPLFPLPRSRDVATEYRLSGVSGTSQFWRLIFCYSARDSGFTVVGCKDLIYAMRYTLRCHLILFSCC